MPCYCGMKQIRNFRNKFLSFGNQRREKDFIAFLISDTQNALLLRQKSFFDRNNWGKHFIDKFYCFFLPLFRQRHRFWHDSVDSDSFGEKIVNGNHDVQYCNISRHTIFFRLYSSFPLFCAISFRCGKTSTYFFFTDALTKWIRMETIRKVKYFSAFFAFQSSSNAVWMQCMQRKGLESWRDAIQNS